MASHPARLLRLARFALVLGAVGLVASACGDDDKPSIPDDFCHGVADGVACDDGDPCTVDDRCGLGVCEGRPALDCSGLDDGACVVGVCDPETVTCVAAPKVEGSSCEDGDLCTTGDICEAGQCVGAVTDCSGLAGPCRAAACAPETGACEVEVFDDNTTCDDGDLCTVDGVCVAGECEETAVDCADLDAPCQIGQCSPDTGACEAVVFEDGDSCEDGNPCTVGETCVAGACGGATQLPDGESCGWDDDLCMTPGTCHSGVCSGGPKECPEPAPCQAAVCDPETGECGVETLPDGTACDDRDACTVGEVCSDGVCGSGENQCFCRDQPDGTACDDGQRCTANDVCDTGACLGTPISCSQLDDGVCLVGACDPTSGECVALPVPDGTTCSDGDVCTSEDRCAGGYCGGQPKDCSALDTACEVGVCEAGQGGCVAEARPDGLPCSDGDACTGGDICEAGVCGGPLDVCGACDGLSVGAACDDGDPCTTGSVCVVQGEALRCEGTPKDCSELDGACVVGMCDAASGGCRTAPRPDGGACDDGDACTTDDTCGGGVCGGSAILMCGAQVSACEPPANNNQVGGASPVPAFANATAVLGRIAPVAEIDWWAVPVIAGRLLTVEAKPHCGSVLDTVVGVYDAAGNLLAEDDDSGANEWSKVTGVVVEETGTVYVGVSAYSDSGTASYLLALTSELPPPCVNDQDCGCSELTCVLGGPDAGRCLPRMPAEVEPNHAPESASPLTVGGEVRGALGEVTESDWYALTLTAGQPLTLGTRGYCEAGPETSVAVFEADGVTQVGAATGGGVGGHARLEGFEAPSDGTYLVRVRSAAATTGPYVLSVQAETCQSDADCACFDQVCGGDGDFDQCVPALELTGDPAALDLGARVRGEIGAAYEIDRYVLSLGAGRYDVATQSFCGAVMDTKLTVLNAAGDPVATDDDSGEGFFAAVSSLEVPAAGTVEVRVSAHGPAVGEYLLVVTPTAD